MCLQVRPMLVSICMHRYKCGRDLSSRHSEECAAGYSFKGFYDLKVGKC